MKLIKKINFYKNLYEWTRDKNGFPVNPLPVEIKEDWIKFKSASIQRVFWVNHRNKIHQIMIRVKKDGKESIHILDYVDGHSICDLYVITTNAITRAKRKIRGISCK